MRAFSGERLVATTATIALLGGCTSQNTEPTSSEPLATVTVTSTPNETITPQKAPASQAPDTSTIAPNAAPTEKPKSDTKDLKSMGVVIVDNCESNDITYYDKEAFNDTAGFVVKTNIDKLAYGEEYDESGPHKAICTNTPVPVHTILSQLRVSIEKKDSKYSFESSSAQTETQKPKKILAVTTEGSLDLKYSNKTTSISCGSKKLTTETVCNDGILSMQEIAEAVIVPSVLRAELQRNVLSTFDKKVLGSVNPGHPLAFVDFELPKNK